MDNSEKRRIRFATIVGLDRDDLALAAEVWHSELSQQIWTSREVVKLATLFSRYLNHPKDEIVSLGNIERSCGLDPKHVLDALRQMQMYGVVNEYAIQAGALLVSLNLTRLQRLRVLEVRDQLIQLSGKGSMREFLLAEAEEHWVPPKSISKTVQARADDHANERKPQSLLEDAV